MPFSFNEPRALILLLTIPPVIFLGVLSARARPRDRGRVSASTVVRSLILLLLTLALAGMQWVSQGGPLNVVFLVDESASMSQESRDAATQYVQKAIASMGPDDRAGVVLFGELAVVDRALSAGTDWKPFGKHPAEVATNLGDALQAGISLFPEGGSRRLVLLSDGAETIGNARDMVGRAGSTGVQLSIVPLGQESQNEVTVDRVASTSTVPDGQQHEVRVLLKSTSDRAATITLTDNGQSVGKQDAQLKPGSNLVTFSVKAQGEGFHTFTAQVASVDDHYTQNNQASSYTVVRTAPSVLIVADSDADALPLKSALEANAVRVTIVSPPGMPRRMDNLRQYDAVVLASASAEGLGTEGQEVLQRYVRDLGHGLVMLGGELSYGAGGYLNSTLEQVLPVRMDVRTSEERASLAMTFLVDKSGSMGRCHCGGQQQFDPSMRSEFGANKVEIAKLAIAKAVALMNPNDQVGVLGFDSAPHWLSTLQPLGDNGATLIKQSLQPVVAQGETNLSSGLQAAVEALASSSAQLKHIIMIGDGWTQQADFSAILAQMDSLGITMSTVGAGEGPGAVMKDLADKAHGQYYRAEDVTNLPDIVLKETVRLIGSYFAEAPVQPLVLKEHPILTGFNPATIPRLLGYNVTTPKQNADIIMASPTGDPILAAWQYGLGRSVSWTSDAKGRWATDWVKWPQFSQFAGQMVSWTFPQEATPGLETTFSLSTGSAPGAQDVAIRVESHETGGAPRNFLETSVTISDTKGVRDKLPLTQFSPGVYGATTTGLTEGVYSVRVEQVDKETHAAVAAQSTGLVVPYPGEFRLSDDGGQAARALLTDLAQLGGGKELDITQPAAAFTHDITAQPQRVLLWSWLLLAAIILFPIDVAIRRLSFTWSDLRQVLRPARPRA
ncbi:MAG TPA: VWA domain-containing protein [Chloroflexia bacterium]|nr:VWA domain-containing protein [Chloroflexia bacterium]